MPSLPSMKLNFGSSSQKTLKSRYQTFLVLSSFTGFVYFVPNILPRIVGGRTVPSEVDYSCFQACQRSNTFHCSILLTVIHLYHNAIHDGCDELYKSSIRIRQYKENKVNQTIKYS